MTTGAPSLARVPTPRPKAPPTSSISSEPATASDPRATPLSASMAPPAAYGAAAPLLPPPPPPPPLPPPPASAAARRGGRPGALDPLSDRSTAFLIRRTLCPQHLEKGRATPAPIEELLPPLTSRNDVDLQLYALLAIILREYVQNWYNKLTPDETFVAEIVQIIAHCTRALEQRLRKVDLESLLLDELPDLLDRHITATRTARDKIAQPPVRSDPRDIYHSMLPLPALSPVPCQSRPGTIAEQAENEAAYRQLLVQGVLAILLPSEDLANKCLTDIVGQIFSELIIGNVIANRLSEPWLIWEGLAIAAKVAQRRGMQSSPDRSRKDPEAPGGYLGISVQRLFLSVVQWCFLAATAIRMVVATVITSRSLPPRTTRGVAPCDDVTPCEPTAGLKGHTHPRGSPKDAPPLIKTPVVAFRCWSAVASLLELDARMPWLCGTLSMAQWLALAGPGRVGNVDGILDRFLSHIIHQNMLAPARLPPLLRTVRGSLFPNNMPGKSSLVAPSSAEELRALRRRCARSLLALVPKRVGSLYFGGDRGGVDSPDREGGPQGGLTESLDMEAVRSGPKNGQSLALNHDQTEIEGARSKDSRGGGSGSGNGDQNDNQPHGLTADRQPGSAKAAAHTPADVPNGRQQPGVSSEAHTVAEIENRILEVFSDAYCNKHLMYSILELVLVRLMPELTEKGVVDLWAERLS